ncbi:MAG: DNA gyrase/topoisomerase IV subunit A [Lewinellaceae bacterium]|nr:DNA gyrase/topoisomerase IV subunit A [Lewinellaceae bacterium]
MSDKHKEQSPNGNGNGTAIALQGMYKDYFLDYASYVILERAVPSVVDGLKPVQRRILHSMKQMDDGRFHKVANIIGQTMQYHPHGDAAIGDALINLGQKDLLIDCQGNWGDIRTGDSAAAPRYIEARLSKFALEVTFNPQTTEWQLSYDGRKKEPVNLPVKFPLLLAQGAEGIAVGLSTKILPHNFIELIKASIKILQGKKVQIYPDFQTGGSIDVEDYQGGGRGGRVKVRASIEIVDKKTLAVRELPYGVTTENLIDSIIKANDKGKIKIKKVVDNTAAEVEVLIELVPGTSPEVTIDALYAFTNCEVSISPNACVIIDDKPRFMTVEEILEINTHNTKDLLQLELEILLHELQEKWHFASLEKLFIEKRIYRDIEECETWEAVLETIDAGLRKYVLVPGQEAKPSDTRLRLLRDISQDDLVRLTEIKIKRISKYNSFQADEYIADLEKQLEQVKHDLENLVDYAIAYYQRLLDKYGKGKERKTKLTTMERVEATEVVAVNAKLYVNRKDGFIGYGLKKDEFVCDCSDIDDIIVFRRDGKCTVTRIAEKTFVGKDIIYVAVWKKGDDRTTYHMIYLDGKTGRSYAKRFNVTGITRDREYDLTQGDPKSKVLYFAVHPNGESELVTIQLTAGSRAKIKQFDYGFGDLAIKGRSAQGNIVTKYPVRNVIQKERGQSTLGAIKIWMDDVSGRLNTDERGRFLGEFDTGDTIIAIYKDGSYEITDYELTHRYNPEDLIHIQKFDPKMVISAVHYDGQKGWTLVKRFQVETTSLQQRFSFITEHNQSKLLFASVKERPKIQYTVQVKSRRLQGVIDIADFIDVKGWKAQGNKLSDKKLAQVKEVEEKTAETPSNDTSAPSTPLHAGDTIEFDVEDDGQGKLF